MNEISFKEGDVVELKGNGHVMTIFSLGTMVEVLRGAEDVYKSSNKNHTHAKCTWFNNATKECKREVFNLAELKKK